MHVQAEHKFPKDFPSFFPSGEIPEGWRVTILSEVAFFSRKPPGLNPGSGQAVPFVPMSRLPDSRLYVDSYEMRPSHEVRSGVFFQEGDILLAKITPCLENGKQGIARNVPGGWGWATTEVFPITAQQINREFLALLLKLPALRQELASKMEGTTGRQRLPKSVVETLALPLPPLDEQRRIAKVLETIQRAIEAQDKVIAAAHELKRSLMNHLFTYGPVPISEACRVPLKETEIGPIPEHWEVMRLGDVSEFLQYGTSKKSHAEPDGKPVLGIPNVVRGYIDLRNLKYIQLNGSEEQKLLLEVGDIIFVRTNATRKNVGRCVVFQGEPRAAVFASYLIRVRVKHAIVLPQFVQAFAMAEVGQQQLSGRATPAADGKFNINTQTIKSVLLPLPPLSEQREIVGQLLTLDRKIAVEEQREATLRVLFKTMLHHLMTGKIRIREDF